MKLRKVIQERIRLRGQGRDIAGDVNAAISANLGEPGTSRTHVSSRQRIVQRSGRTEIFEDEREGGKRDRGEAR